MRQALAALIGIVSFLPLLWLVFLSWNEEFVDLRADVWVWNSSLSLAALSAASCIWLVPRGKRALWAVVLILANFFALPFFWAWYVRPYILKSRDGLAPPLTHEHR